MARIHNVYIPDANFAWKGLTCLYGIGKSTAFDILEALKIDPYIRVKDLATEQIILISNFISEHYKVEGDLKREVLSNIKALIEMRSYRGMRHAVGLTVRGQRTKNNNGAKRRTKAGLARRKK